MHITAENVREYQPHRYIVEASDLGWLPGFFPAQLSTTLGNQLPFEKAEQDDDRVFYKQQFSCTTLVVFND